MRLLLLRKTLYGRVPAACRPLAFDVVKHQASWTQYCRKHRSLRCCQDQLWLRLLERLLRNFWALLLLAALDCCWRSVVMTVISSYWFLTFNYISNNLLYIRVFWALGLLGFGKTSSLTFADLREAEEPQVDREESACYAKLCWVTLQDSAWGWNEESDLRSLPFCDTRLSDSIFARVARETSALLSVICHAR